MLLLYAAAEQLSHSLLQIYIISLQFQQIRSVERVSAQCYESKVHTCRGLNRSHIGDIYTYFIWYPLSPTIFEIFEVKSYNLDLGWFKVNQSQRSSIAHG